MNKIIFVSGIQIFPPESGGQLRSANLCLALAKLGYKVEIYSLTGRKNDYLSLKSSDETKIADNVTEYVNRNPLWGFIQFIFYKLHLPPLWLSWLTAIHGPRVLKNKLEKASSLVLDFPFLHPLGRFKTDHLIVNTHNAEYELYPDSPVLQRMVKNIECAAFKRASSVLFCNESDFMKFKEVLENSKNKVSILPNGIHLESFTFDSLKRESIRTQYKISNNATVFLFTGSKYQPNVKAFNYLKEWADSHAKELIQEKIIILVAGTVTDVFVDLPYFKAVGKVPEMYSYFWAADFGLNATTEGSGTNVKMIEYLAAKLPIVTTAFGSRGTKLINNETCLEYNQDNFLAVLQKAASMNNDQKSKMAEEAFRDNETIIDMSKAIKNLPIKW